MDEEVWVEAPSGEDSQPLVEMSSGLTGTGYPSSGRTVRAEIDNQVAASETPVDYRLSELRRGSGSVESVEAGARGESVITGARPRGLNSCGSQTDRWLTADQSWQVSSSTDRVQNTERIVDTDLEYGDRSQMRSVTRSYPREPGSSQYFLTERSDV